MKSLDIDTASPTAGAYRNCRVMIEFTGGNYTERMQRGANHKVTVPYCSLSKKLQTIHRLGGKIINVSILHFQLDIANGISEQVDSEQVDSEQFTALILKEIPAIAPDITPVAEVQQVISEVNQAIAIEQSIEKPVVDTLDLTVKAVSPEVAEIVAEAKSEDTFQSVLETISQEISDISSENISPVVTTKNKKSVAASTTKAPKPKASHGFNKCESPAPFKESIAINETSTTSHQVLEPIPEPISNIILEEAVETIETIIEIIPEQKSEPFAEVVAEINLEVAEETILEVNTPIPPTTELIESTTPLQKSKKTKTSSKSGHGFNKPKGDPKSPRSPQKPI